MFSKCLGAEEVVYQELRLPVFPEPLEDGAKESMTFQPSSKLCATTSFFNHCERRNTGSHLCPGPWETCLTLEGHFSYFWLQALSNYERWLQCSFFYLQLPILPSPEWICQFSPEEEPKTDLHAALVQNGSNKLLFFTYSRKILSDCSACW